jgi:uncharacterized small protein (DUF1192 family)
MAVIMVWDMVALSGGVAPWRLQASDMGKTALAIGRQIMLEEPAGPRGGRGDALLAVTREDLDLFGVSELEERIELARVRGQIEKKRAGRSAADAFFNLGKT